MPRHRNLVIASVACMVVALSLSSTAIAKKPKKTQFEEIGKTVHYAGSVFERAELTTPPFNPGPNGKLRFRFNGAVSYDPKGHGSLGRISGTLTCTKGSQQKSASVNVPTYFPFEYTYKTSVAGIKDPKRCTLQVSAWWDPPITPSTSDWPHGLIEIAVDLKK